MRRYTISNRSKYSKYPSRKKIGYYNYYSSLSDESEINDTTIHSIVFDEHWFFHRTNFYTIRILSRINSVRFRNTSNNRIRLGLKGLYSYGKI